MRRLSSTNRSSCIPTVALRSFHQPASLATSEAPFSLLDELVVTVRPDPTGVLTIDFEGGDRVVVPVNQSYENWQLLYSDGTMLIGLPGGGITEYPPRLPARAQDDQT